MHHHVLVHQPPHNPCWAILGAVSGSKLDGIIASKIYMHLEDVGIHWHVEGMQMGRFPGI